MDITPTVNAIFVTMTSVRNAYWSAINPDAEHYLQGWFEKLFHEYTNLTKENLDDTTPEFLKAVEEAKSVVGELTTLEDHLQKIISDTDKAATIVQDAGKALIALKTLA
jgi:hypothetical protein